MGAFGAPDFTQLAPPSRLLKAPPLSVAAYNVRGLCGSTESAAISPPWGPMLCHSLVPAQTNPVPKMANTTFQDITWFQLALFKKKPTCHIAPLASRSVGVAHVWLSVCSSLWHWQGRAYAVILNRDNY